MYVYEMKNDLNLKGPVEQLSHSTWNIKQLQVIPWNWLRKFSFDNFISFLAKYKFFIARPPPTSSVLGILMAGLKSVRIYGSPEFPIWIIRFASGQEEWE